MSELEEQPTGGISRRTVTKAMAWAVPVIAIAAPVPAFAASNNEFVLSGLGCKLPGKSNLTFKGYAFRLSIFNNPGPALTIDIQSIRIGTRDLGEAAIINLITETSDFENPFTLTANTDYPSLVLLTEKALNSANGTLIVTYTTSDEPGVIKTATATVTSAPPINGASCNQFTTPEKVIINSELGPAPVWVKETPYEEGDLVTVAGAFWVANNSGTSGAAFPVTPATLPDVGETVTDNDIVWTRIQ